jgi:hypothetical protein
MTHPSQGEDGLNPRLDAILLFVLTFCGSDDVCDVTLEAPRVERPAVAGVKSSLRFDYGALSAPIAGFLKAQAHRIRRQAAISIIHIGKDLIAAKHYLCHGTFRDWVTAEVGIPPRTAQAYMHVAQWASHKNAVVALLPPSILYLLSTSSTPQSYVDDILRRAEAGEPIVVSAVREELKGLREKDRRQQALGAALPTPRGARRGHGTWPIKDELDTRLQQAVAVLAQGLPTDDFARLRDILTSKSILEDTKLTRKIAAAFSAWTGTGRNEVNAARKPSVGASSNENQMCV